MTLIVPRFPPLWEYIGVSWVLVLIDRNYAFWLDYIYLFFANFSAVSIYYLVDCLKKTKCQFTGDWWVDGESFNYFQVKKTIFYAVIQKFSDEFITNVTKSTFPNDTKSVYPKNIVFSRFLQFRGTFSI